MSTFPARHLGVRFASMFLDPQGISLFHRHLFRATRLFSGLTIMGVVRLSIVQIFLFADAVATIVTANTANFFTFAVVRIAPFFQFLR
jgi:hypothetical protein